MMGVRVEVIDSMESNYGEMKVCGALA